MAVRTDRTPRPPTPPARGSLEQIMERIQWLYGEKNHDALRDEAVTLVNKFAQMNQEVQKLSVVQMALREKLAAATAHEHYAVVITGCEQNGRLTAEVAGLGNSRVRVAVHPDVAPDQIQVGAVGLVSRERNCLLEVTTASAHWQDTGTFERYMEGNDRILLRDRETLLAVDIAQGLRDMELAKGDLIGYDRDVAGMAFQRLELPQSNDLFDEDVTDDFAKLGGLDAQIAQIKQHIDFRFRHPELAKKYALKERCGILLMGTPGNGKTRIARCCAGYVRQLFPDQPCRFMHIAGSSDYTMWFGQSEQKIIERFKAAREAAADGPVIMFWDEIDSIAKRRGSDYGSGAPDRILNTLLSQIDGVVPLGNVILLFATNRCDVLDPGLLRPGRTDVKITIPSPNRRAAAAILQGYIGSGRPLAAGQTSTAALTTPLLSRLFTPNGKYAEVARVKLNDGRQLPVAGRALLSGAMLENVVEVAAQQAAVREAQAGQPGLTEDDLAAALESEMVAAVSLLAPENVKSYVASIPRESRPIAVESLLTSSTSSYRQAS